MVDTGESPSAPHADLPALKLTAGEVYAVRWATFPDGTAVRTEVGSLETRNAASGRRAWIDPRQDVSPDGSTYLFKLTISQEFETDPVVYETRVRRANAQPTAAPSSDPMVRVWPRRLDPALLALRPDEVTTAIFRVGEPGRISFVPQPGSVSTADYLDAQEERVRDIAHQQERIRAAAQGILSSPILVRSSLRVHGLSWSMQSVAVEGKAADLLKLAESQNFIDAFVEGERDLTTNDGLEIRTTTQVGQFFVGGFDGEFPTGRSSESDIFAAIIDVGFDTDHPAWRDTSSPSSSRLVDQWGFSGTSWSTFTTNTASSSNRHGTNVAGMFFADLMDGQDSTVTTLPARRNGTGTTKEASFSFINEGSGGPSTDDMADLVVSENFDVVNRSVVFTGTQVCSTTSATHDGIDRMFLDGTFVVQAPGNQDNCNENGWTTCGYARPAGAAGAFPVNALTISSGTDLDTAPVGQGCRGGDALGRAVIAMAAPGGRETSTAPTFNDSYTSLPTAVSFANPVAAGAVADLRDFLSQTSSPIATDAGFVQSIMGLMGDRQTGSRNGSGPKAIEGDGFDPIWGAGRLRMRMFNAAGMDAPFGFGAEQVLLAHGAVEQVDINGGATIPNGADIVRASIWWFEPNIEDGAASVADIDSGFCLGATGGCDTIDNQVQRQRYYLWTLAAGGQWFVKLTGTKIPASGDSNYLSGQTKRKVYVSWFFEDTARDDADGPDSTID